MSCTSSFQKPRNRKRKMFWTYVWREIILSILHREILFVFHFWAKILVICIWSLGEKWGELKKLHIIIIILSWKLPNNACSAFFLFSTVQSSPSSSIVCSSRYQFWMKLWLLHDESFPSLIWRHPVFICPVRQFGLELPIRTLQEKILNWKSSGNRKSGLVIH